MMDGDEKKTKDVVTEIKDDKDNKDSKDSKDDKENKDHKENSDSDSGSESEHDDDDDCTIIDHQTFDQLLEMDDEEDHEFSRSLVWNYFEQAQKTFDDMDKAMKKLDFPDLSRLGHFLKGSSAALGLTKVKESCEKLQNLGNRKDENGANTISNEVAEKKIGKLLIRMRKEYEEARSYLEDFYEDQEPQPSASE
ncbi:hypothetical protein BGW38_003196 [Lunasporangiospora selenospora]|uniref:HPt domain-containing protein n=1 Tax=Lunasporangiospora selenospora TaxID=979761 RepID=A0A9P6FT30_9FUNG|nr:hypothetical protein BGW38_003196 [Lunasporangiospora selenospora]